MFYGTCLVALFYITLGEIILGILFGIHTDSLAQWVVLKVLFKEFLVLWARKKSNWPQKPRVVKQAIVAQRGHVFKKIYFKLKGVNSNKYRCAANGWLIVEYYRSVFWNALIQDEKHFVLSGSISYWAFTGIE